MYIYFRITIHTYSIAYLASLPHPPPPGARAPSPAEPHTAAAAGPAASYAGSRRTRLERSPRLPPSNYPPDPVVPLTGRSGIVIERHVQSFERLLHFFVVPVDDFPGGDPVFLRPQRDGRTVFIAAAHPHHVRTGHALKARTDVTRQVGAGDVADVNLAIGIRQGRRHHQTFGVPV